VATDFNGPLDLVFDDASHFYRFSKVSFETLFPLLRPGGLYVIEDWSWVCWSELPEDFNPSMTALPADITPQEIPLPRLVCELAMATGKLEGFLAWAEDGHYTLNTWIASMHVFADFIVLERGKADPAVMGELKLQDFLPRTTIRPAG
jgi:SAM-dependent methyltransferase